jgi:hypothetical protein
MVRVKDVSNYINLRFMGNAPCTSLGFHAFVEKYTARRMSYQKDALYTLRGYLAMADYLTYLGLPVMVKEPEIRIQEREEVNAGLAFGLSWAGRLDDSPGDERLYGRFVFEEEGLLDIDRSLARLNDFPSWSWAVWEAPKCGHSPIAKDASQGFWMIHHSESRMRTNN